MVSINAKRPLGFHHFYGKMKKLLLEGIEEREAGHLMFPKPCSFTEAFVGT